MTAPSGARLPRRITSPPFGFSALVRSRARLPGRAFRRRRRLPAPSDRPVTVGADPCDRAASTSRCATSGLPPAACRSVATKRPDGFRSASSGTRALMRSKSVERQLEARLVRDGHQVQHGVGRSAGRRDRRDRVLERGLRDDVARLDAAAHQIHHALARRPRDVGLRRIGGRHAAAAQRRDAEELADDRHRVGRELAAAGARAGARRVLELAQVVVADACRPRARRPPRTRPESSPAWPCHWPGRDRAAVEHEARHVQPRERHRRRRESSCRSRRARRGRRSRCRA